MHDIASLSALITRIYTAMGDEKLWVAAMQSTARWSDAGFSQLLLWNGDTQEASFPLTDGQDLSEVRKYIAGFSSDDPRIPFLFQRLDNVAGDMPTAEAVIADSTSAAVFTGSAGERGDIGALMHQYNVRWVLSGFFSEAAHRAAPPGAPGTPPGLRRAFKGGFYSSEDAATFAALIPHLSRAFTLDFRFAALNWEVAARRAAMDLSTSGIIILDSADRILFTNKRAEEILRQGVLSDRQGKIAANQPAHQQKLLAALTHARSGRSRTMPVTPAADGVSPDRMPPEAAAPGGRWAEDRRLEDRRSGDRWAGNGAVLSEGGERLLYVMAFPLPRSNVSRLPWLPDQSIILHVAESDRQHKELASLLPIMFGLTPGECRLAMKLAEGKPLTRAATELGIGRETARTQLKGLFDKTGQRRQAALMKLFAELSIR